MRCTFACLIYEKNEKIICIYNISYTKKQIKLELKLLIEKVGKKKERNRKRR